MAYAAAAPIGAAPRLRVETLRAALLWLTGVAGAFVFMEPSPYEVMASLTIVVFAISGLALTATLMPFIILLVLCNIGYGIAVISVIDQTKPVIWVFVSAFLAATAVFYAAVLGTNTERRLQWLLRGYMVAALIASIVAIGGYFHLFGGLSEMFLRYDRARGTFNDPNVLGAFLVLPGLLLLERILSERMSAVLRSGMLLLPMIGALLLTFSRAAWGQFAFCSLMLMLVMFFTSGSSTQRARIVAIAVIGGVLLAIFIAALLSLDQVAELFKERASFDQSYDTGHLGRFGRYTLGASLALDSPFGIGPLQFTTIFPEDPHNSYLNSFMSGGWLTGISYFTLTLLTIFSGLRYIALRTPWRPLYQVIYVAYLGTAVESAIIDSDHWRHYFLLLGTLWGLIAVSRSYRATSAAAPAFAR